MDVGIKIKELRKQHNMTTEELAKLCNISQPVISKLENGNRIPDVPTLKKICQVFNITLADFFTPENSSTSIDDSLKELLNNAKNLTPDQLESLSKFIKTITNKK